MGRTRLRFANLPVGGTVAIAASLILPGRVSAAVRAFGAGALVGAIGWGIVDPLPSLPPGRESRRRRLRSGSGSA